MLIRAHFGLNISLIFFIFVLVSSPEAFAGESTCTSLMALYSEAKAVWESTKSEFSNGRFYSRENHTFSQPANLQNSLIGTSSPQAKQLLEKISSMKAGEVFQGDAIQVSGVEVKRVIVGRKGFDPQKVIIIGGNHQDRVMKFSSEIASTSFAPSKEATEELTKYSLKSKMVVENTQWLNTNLQDGYTVIDLGPKTGTEMGYFYSLETEIIERYIRDGAQI